MAKFLGGVRVALLDSPQDVGDFTHRDTATIHRPLPHWGVSLIC